MFFYEGFSCPACNQQFIETDDIVACPVCGAPHHRACWQKEGHCHLESLHGTEEQWKRETAHKAESEPEQAASPTQTVCPNCGYRNPEFAEFCAHCGRTLTEEEPEQSAPSYQEYAPFRVNHTPYNVASEERVADVSVADLTASVSSGVAYYLPRFRRMAAEDSSVSWNWSAFLLGAYWLFYRKQYGIGTLFLSLQLIVSTLLSVFYYTTLYPIFGTGTLTAANETLLLEKLQDGSLWGPLIAMWLLLLVVFLMHLFLGLCGNRLYFNTCLRRVRHFRQKKPEGYPAELAALGGTSLVLGFTAYIALEFIGSMILSFLIH